MAPRMAAGGQSPQIEAMARGRGRDSAAPADYSRHALVGRARLSREGTSVSVRSIDFRSWQILLQKYFGVTKRKFPEPPTRFTRGDVRVLSFHPKSITGNLGKVPAIKAKNKQRPASVDRRACPSRRLFQAPEVRAKPAADRPRAVVFRAIVSLLGG